VTCTPAGLRDLVRAQRLQQAGALRLACAAAAAVSIAAVALLGLSGWFLAAAAVAGAAGPAAVLAFNYVLPSAGIRFLAIARTGARYAERVAGHQAALKALAEIRPALFAGLASGPPERMLALSSGEASARLVQDVDAIETLFVRRSAPWSAGAAVVAGVLLLLLATPWAAVIFLAGFAVQIGLGAWIGARVSRAPGEAMLRASGRLKDAFQSWAAAAPELLCFGMQDRVVERLMAHDRALGEARERGWSAEGVVLLPQAALTGLTVAGVLAVSAAAPLPLAALAALAAAVAMEGGGGFARMFDRDGALQAASLRLDDILATQQRPSAAPTFIGARMTLRIGRTAVELAGGQRLALVGRSGTGKTRLLETLMGLREPTPGRIRIDGFALEEAPAGAARGLFALAPQDAGLISGTLRENLRLGAPNASDALLWSALVEACLADKVRALPQGLDTWIGESGARLSGGERRRLSLARAYLRPTPWLLLDEPTEGLDAATETAVIAALASRLDRTGQGVIMVSHRPAPLALCPLRLELDGCERREFLAVSQA
jgi:ATP-binding cassette subfamily C protein CydC